MNVVVTSLPHIMLFLILFKHFFNAIVSGLFLSVKPSGLVNYMRWHALFDSVDSSLRTDGLYTGNFPICSFYKPLYIGFLFVEESI